jgi:hypothetical protein
LRRKRDEKFIPMKIGESRFSLFAEKKGREVYPDENRGVPFLALCGEKGTRSLSR